MYSLTVAMLGQRPVAAQLTLEVLTDAAEHSERCPERLLVETHRRAVAYLRYRRRWRPIPDPQPGAISPALLRGLEPQLRAVVELVFLGGYTTAEIADRWGCGRAGVARTLWAAVGELAARIPRTR